MLLLKSFSADAKDSMTWKWAVLGHLFGSLQCMEMSTIRTIEYINNNNNSNVALSLYKA